MKRNPFWSWMLVLGAGAALAVSGCAKKQVVAEEVEPEPPAVEQVAPAPVQPAPVVTERPIAPPRPEPAPPSRTAAVETAPEEPVAGKGLSQETSAGLERIHFDFDQYNLRSDARDTLGLNAEYLQEAPGVRVRIEGHCDERGTLEYNLALGERRAKSAFQYLMDLGVDPNRMTVVSYGEEAPLDLRHDEDAWAKNRRAEFVEIQ